MADFDAVAQRYQSFLQLPVCRDVETYSFEKLAGDCRGLSILDLACGEGYYSRFFRQHGAARVIGVDISAEMIRLAAAQEHSDPLGIDYRVGDACDVKLKERFDIVSGAWLLQNARDSEGLRAMCMTIAQHLKPEDVFIGLNINPTFSGDGMALAKYGHTFRPNDAKEGDALYSRFYPPAAEPFEMLTYQKSLASYAWAFEQAGLTSPEWVPVSVRPERLAQDGADFWAYFLQHPPITGLRSRAMS
ncbi:SAM-dependent methyltransferase [Paraburkholderia youngii]|uniref:class I SAM-dependent methyltransferase n=1 Tax=Paraburkholderia youngii TaxID=2782701 RepID=UPI003D1ABF7C